MKSIILIVVAFVLTGCETINVSPPFTSEKSSDPHAVIYGNESNGAVVGIFSVDGKCLKKGSGFDSSCYMPIKNIAYVLEGHRTINVSCFTSEKYSNVDIKINVQNNEKYTISCTPDLSKSKAIFEVFNSSGNKIEIDITQIDLNKN